VARSRALGRGLAALVEEFPGDGSRLVEIELGQIRPNPKQPRQQFDEDALAELAESIAAEGVVQPILVRAAGGTYEIIAGERRWRAAARAGLVTVPALIRPAGDREALILALAENLAREDLNAIDEARAYATLADELGLTQVEIARRVGKSRAAVANTLRLLELPDAALELVRSGALSEGHGRAILQVDGQDERVQLARRAVGRRLSVRETEAAAKRLGRVGRRRRRSGIVDEELAALAIDAAWQSLSLPATVRIGPRGGTVGIRFRSPDELGRIIDQLRAERSSAWAD
jgi:ParB family transcriptional regulator, chromosome partitioning protein